MNKDQLIKVYGTLKNHTVDSAISDGDIHNDALALASDLYDDQFGESTKVNNFQDIINKRVKGITRPNNGPTYVNEDLYVDGDIYIKVGGQYVKLDLGDLINTVNQLKSYWTLEGNNLVAKANCSATASGFYDRTVN